VYSFIDNVSISLPADEVIKSTPRKKRSRACGKRAHIAVDCAESSDMVDYGPMQITASNRAGAPKNYFTNVFGTALDVSTFLCVTSSIPLLAPFGEE
jgi:hypothetical protein